MKQETPEEKTKEQLLQEEATTYYNLSKDYRRDRYLKDESEVKYFNLGVCPEQTMVEKVEGSRELFLHQKKLAIFLLLLAVQFQQVRAQAGPGSRCNRQPASPRAAGLLHKRRGSSESRKYGHQARH